MVVRGVLLARSVVLALVAVAACRGGPRPAPTAAGAGAAPTAGASAPPTAASLAAGSGAAGAAGGQPVGRSAADRAADDALIGLWKAKRRFGPDARGPLMLQRGPAGWTADFVGERLAVRADHAGLAFELPGGDGGFLGQLAADGRRIVGHWTPPPSVVHGSRFAVPVVLEADGAARWRGQVVPLDDTFTLYLKVDRRPDGTLGAFLRNPERNIGVRYDVDRIARDGGAVRLIGRRGGPETTLLAGSYDADNQVLTLAFPERGGSYDFRRDGEHSEFYPRGAHPARYAYQPPPALDDGWPTATLDEVAISRPGIEAFIQHLIEQPIDSVHAPQV